MLRFFSSKPFRSSLDAVTFDASRYAPQGTTEGRRVWHTPDGDGLGLFHFPIPPNLPAGLKSPDDVSATYLKLIDSTEARLVEADLIKVEGVISPWVIIKVPQSKLGFTYVGSITLPFEEFSFVVKLQCAEHDNTGIREAVVIDRAMAAGVSPDALATLPPAWQPDNGRFDEEFPHHPLSRVRRELCALLPSLKIEAKTKRQPRLLSAGQ